MKRPLKPLSITVQAYDVGVREAPLLRYPFGTTGGAGFTSKVEADTRIRFTRGDGYYWNVRMRTDGTLEVQTSRAMDIKPSVSNVIYLNCRAGMEPPHGDWPRRKK